MAFEKARSGSGGWFDQVSQQERILGKNKFELGVMLVQGIPEFREYRLQFVRLLGCHSLSAQLADSSVQGNHDTPQCAKSSHGMGNCSIPYTPYAGGSPPDKNDAKIKSQMELESATSSNSINQCLRVCRCPAKFFCLDFHSRNGGLGVTDRVAFRMALLNLQQTCGTLHSIALWIKDGPAVHELGHLNHKGPRTPARKRQLKNFAIHRPAWCPKQKAERYGVRPRNCRYGVEIEERS